MLMGSSGPSGTSLNCVEFPVNRPDTSSSNPRDTRKWPTTPVNEIEKEWQGVVKEVMESRRERGREVDKRG